VLTLDDRKLLPPGVYVATQQEVEDLFGQRKTNKKNGKSRGKGPKRTRKAS
jgi:hypothetical protein